MTMYGNARLDPKRCKVQVRIKGVQFYRTHQCTRHATTDGYCNQHHPDNVAKRKIEVDKNRADRVQLPAKFYFAAMKEIKKLKQEKNRLLRENIDLRLELGRKLK